MGYKDQSKIREQISGLRPFRPSDMFGGKIFALDLGKEEAQERITVFFITNKDGMFYELGLRNLEGDTSFFNINGKITEYNRADQMPRVVQKEKKDSEGVDCNNVGARVTAMTGNSALGGCIEAMCRALQCRTLGECGEETQTTLDDLERALCGRYYDGQLRVWNELE